MAESVRELMSSDPKSVEAGATVQDAAELMAQEDIGDVLVVENGEVKGIVTDRDIVVRAIANGNDPSDTSVREVATTDVDFLSPDDPVDDAVKKMEEKNIRRLPVVDDGRPVGIVSLGDLAKAKDSDSALADISSASPNN
jgi:CBS domain-containing protein